MQAKKIDFAVVTTETTRGMASKHMLSTVSDGYLMRRMAVDMGIPIFTNSESAKFFIDGIRRYTRETLPVLSWQEYINQLVVKEDR